ncbi:hypothetical protein ACFX2B_045574 [Malus domestica]
MKRKYLEGNGRAEVGLQCLAKTGRISQQFFLPERISNALLQIHGLLHLGFNHEISEEAEVEMEKEEELQIASWRLPYLKSKAACCLVVQTLISQTPNRQDPAKIFLACKWVKLKPIEKE